MLNPAKRPKENDEQVPAVKLPTLPPSSRARPGASEVARHPRDLARLTSIRTLLLGRAAAVIRRALMESISDECRRAAASPRGFPRRSAAIGFRTVGRHRRIGRHLRLGERRPRLSEGISVT